MLDGAARVVPLIQEAVRLEMPAIAVTDHGNTFAAYEFYKTAKDAGIKHIPLTIGESPNGPPDYEVARDADVTVLMWKGHRVRVNHAFKGELTDQDIGAVVADIPKVLAD